MTRRLALVLVPAVAALLASLAGEAQEVRVRRPFRLPDVPGYLTLQGDFHTHTVFSDGKVWPDVRAEEAWREGYDAIAVTDHLEYLPHRADLPPSHDRPWEIAAPHGESLGLVVLRGSEITRKMPPGHLNAIFVKSSLPLDVPDWRQAVRAAREQGAFVFWNHPGWRGHQKDGVARWYAEHTELVEAGLLDGIEVANDREFYPEALRWALANDLAVLASSDAHDPVNLAWHVSAGDRRPVTLVFAKERSEAGIREALFARRTAALAGGVLAGREALLAPLVAAALEVENPSLTARAGTTVLLRVRNRSDLRLELEGSGAAGGFSVPRRLVVAADGTSLLEITVPKDAAPGPARLEIPWVISNVKVSPDAGLPFTLSVDLEVLPRLP